MNDTIIINTISKIHFILVSILVFIFLFFSASFILLQNGLYLQDISLKNVKVKKLYIKWDENIRIGVQEVVITPEEKNAGDKQIYEKALLAAKELLLYEKWLGELHVKKITLGDITAELSYIQNKDGYLKASSPRFMLKSSMIQKNGVFEIALENFELLQKELLAKGKIYISEKDGLQAHASFDVTLAGETELDVYMHSDAKKLTYKIESQKDITNAKKIVKMLDIDPDIKYWFYDTISDISTLSLKSLGGRLDYDKPEKAFLNLYAKAAANDVLYRYDENLSAVKAASVELEFKEGVLYIRPKEAYSYGFFLDKSYLKIDFSKKEELLSLYLLFKAKIDENILGILNRYGIKLPFIQTKGDVDADLKLDINLRTLDIEAHGDFYTDDSKIEYLGLDIDLFDVHVALHNQNVHVENMYAKYQDIASSHVDIAIDAKNSSTVLKFKADKIEFAQKGLALISGAQKPLLLTYTANPKEEYINIAKSLWKYKEHTLHVDKMKVAFDIDDLKAKVPSTSIKATDLASADFKADIDIKSQKADIEITAKEIYSKEVKFKKPYPNIRLTYEKDVLTAVSDKSLTMDHHGKKIFVEGINLKSTSDKLTLKNTKFIYGDIAEGSLSALYDIKTSKGVIDIYSLILKSDTGDKVLEIEDGALKLDLDRDNGYMKLNTDGLGLTFIDGKEGWSLKLASLEKLLPYSKLLKSYRLTNGEASFHGKKQSDLIDFYLTCNYKYKILSTKDKPIESYKADGTFNLKTKEAALRINDAVDIDIKDDIKIKADGVGINIHEISSFIEDNNSSENKNSVPDIYLDANDSFFYLGESRRIISDSIKLKYQNEELDIKLKHKQASASFILANDKFHFFGENFGDEFMNRLFDISKFNGGALSFYINGSAKEYNGTFLVTDTTILDYKILNNILAFVNTVPSLVTFSVPGYSSKGIKAQKAHINFTYKDTVYNIKDAYLKSKEIEIVGQGEASTLENSIDMDLNLITELGSAVSKIPLVGHILLGKENVSTTLKVTGKLDDPTVETQIAKDIAAAPLNIIKRTLMYPFEIFKKEEE